MPKKEEQTFEIQTATTKKKYQVLQANFPLVVQDVLLTTGAIVELEETDQVKALVGAKILKEV